MTLKLYCNNCEHGRKHYMAERHDGMGALACRRCGARNYLVVTLPPGVGVRSKEVLRK